MVPCTKIGSCLLTKRLSVTSTIQFSHFYVQTSCHTLLALHVYSHMPGVCDDGAKDSDP